jgi:ubiquinone/menaquinone biosynthesis C-methylase UbiE
MQDRIIMEENNVKIGGQYRENNSPCEFDIPDNEVAIFLSTDLISRFDEYSSCDPYQVEQEIQSEFHQRRIKCTIELVKKTTTGMSNVRLLDIGCGEGHITAGIKNEFSYFDVIGTDASITACRHGKEKYPEVKFMVADAYHLPCPDECFDIIVLNNIWEHVPDPLRLLSEVRRILRANGKIIISTPSRYRLGNIFSLIRYGRVGFMSKQHVTEYTVGQVCEQLQYGGFNVLENFSPILTSKSIADLFIKHPIKFMINLFLRMIRSHHSLEGTVFFVANKRTN